MRFPEIEVRMLAHTVPDRRAIRGWIRSMEGGENHELPSNTAATDADLTVAYAAKRCYKSFEVAGGMNPNITKVRKDIAKYLDNILASGHGSVLEHVSFTFAIENLTRVATAELNRHRAGCAISEQSMRYVRFNDLPFWMPLSLRDEDAYAAGGPTCDKKMAMNERRERTREMISDLLEYTEKTYKRLVDLWGLDGEDFAEKKKLTSMLRRIIPMGVCTGGVWTFNVRALRHIIAMRSNPAAEEEIAFIFGMIGKMMHDTEPNLFGDFEVVDGFWVPKYQKV